MCPALAVSNTAINALAMGAATTFVLVMAGLSCRCSEFHTA